VAISCSTILCQAILRKTWFDPDDQAKIKADAFFRRRPEQREGGRDPRDEDGLSLFLADQVTPDDCISQFKRCFGVVSLHVGRLLDLGLRVIEDAQDHKKVLITNLPFETAGTAEEEKLAGEVAHAARIVKKHKPLG
jgi:hypothetical protein